jgi:hypothetical protein
MMKSNERSMFGKLWAVLVVVIVVGVAILWISKENPQEETGATGIKLEPTPLQTRVVKTEDGRDSVVMMTQEEIESIRAEEQISKEKGKVEERMAALEARITSTEPLQETMRLLSYARDERSVPLFRDILERNPRGMNRAAACIGLTVVGEYLDSEDAASALERALQDRDVDVRLRAALGLVRMGQGEKALETLHEVARADDIADWIIDWDGYFGPGALDTQSGLVQAAEFKNGMRIYAINGLGSVGSDRAFAYLRDVLEEKGNQAYIRGGTLMTFKDYIEKSGVLEGRLKGVKPPIW